jgi:hypothetical protein
MIDILVIEAKYQALLRRLDEAAEAGGGRGEKLGAWRNKRGSQGVWHIPDDDPHGACGGKG